MIGLILLTHGQMAIECLRTAEMIIGPVNACVALTLDRSCAVEVATRELAVAIADVGADADGVLILTDLFGGTPTNIAAEFLDEGVVEILTGFNLPMLIKAASARQGKPLAELTGFLRDYGQQAILRPADLLNGQRQ
ncbi:PTS sugar transporter subunit IIA [Geopsychrobacter electrodiphilus]|uniref:PTS sugar transporter subunit IIA n=1 Tax=Geopsychrobacter electrodiphilus TaxID=225196 RepID=UPI00036BCF2E|nr:hypothetical protein [Geopsychrobacter electrodiphilus]